MAATWSYMACARFSMMGLVGGGGGGRRDQQSKRRVSSIIRAQQQAGEVQFQETQEAKGGQEKEEKQEQQWEKRTIPRPVEAQVNVKSKNMGREYESEWLCSVTRHVRIYAAYIDPDTWEMDQTQTDVLTLLLDPSNEFVWNDDARTNVYSYFQELVDHYEGAPLTEYTLRLIGSDLEHYIRKMLYDGEIKYNMDARVLNFSMGRPRVMFNNEVLPSQEYAQY
ncbi:hypothetical protein Tsubulata_038183 [Turnera subulata]|uniref:NAD(P)H-quinone oxidoreductase subunit M, chloroplastic n=1 Tax=Turnera subulata TaxID=218843 RepID=A0A9Q0G0H1_9ROSI|nr:hypothetical protein Tsubulata_038183 [Turnera subulata]